MIKDSVQIEIVNSIVIVKIIGDLDFFDYSAFYYFLETQLKEGNYKTIILSFEDNSKIGSTAIGSLLSFFNKGVIIKLVAPDKSIAYNIFKLSKILEVFDYYETVADALESV